MCGICGIVSSGDPDITAKLQVMNRALRHRGPDDEGYFVGDGVGLAMRRLSIIDLVSGHQPIYSQGRNLVIVFNGEIYNYRELRETHLVDYPFQTCSDTEVILGLYEQYEYKCLDYLNGIFAFAVYNISERELFIARDRLGVKPLYYYCDKDRFMFSSEAKAFWYIEEAELSFDLRVLNDYLSFGIIPQPRTIYKRVSKLRAGHYLLVRDEKLSVKRYWEPDGREQIDCSFDEAREHVRTLVGESVRRQMVSDVPVGVFLSGGVDSSIVAYEMSRVAPNLRSLTIGFKDASNETDLMYSREIAKKLGTDHNESIVEPEDVSVLRTVVTSTDEPFGITSLIPLYLNSKIASESLKVVLSGDGADELFGGYERHRLVKYLLLLGAFQGYRVNGIARSVGTLLQRYGTEKLRKGNHYLLQPVLKAVGAGDIASGYLEFLNTMRLGAKAEFFDAGIIDEFEELEYLSEFRRVVGHNLDAASLNRILEFDLRTSLSDEMLAKVDCGSMLCSLEVRVPYLDSELVDFVIRLPFNLKVRSRGKDILKESYVGSLPRSVLFARKRGFNVPIDNWIRGSWNNEFLDAFRNSAALDLGIKVPSLLQKFSEFCQDPTMIGSKHFYYIYVLIRWADNLASVRKSVLRSS